MTEGSPFAPSVSRLGRRAWLAGMLASVPAAALDRLPYGGRVRLTVPWSTRALDPHDLGDPTAALFGSAIADPVYALDAGGAPYPTLAKSLPERAGAGARIELRPGLTSARGRALDARDLVFSLRRAAQRGAVALLDALGDPKLDGNAVVFQRADPETVARALSSPLTALVPRGFSALSPDGTGAFKATTGVDRLLLERNERAARGPALLDAIDVTRARDLADALRSYEAADADVGWLGAGLHRPRPGSVSFDAGRFGWIVLHTGATAGTWGAPGIAQQLVDTITEGQVKHLGLHGLADQGSGQRWGGPPTTLLVRDDAPHLGEIAGAVAALIGQPGHEVTVSPTPLATIAERKSDRRFDLLLDFVRPLDASSSALLPLLTAAGRDLARRPPRDTGAAARDVTRTLALGVVGELRVEGARAPDVRGLDAWSLGDAWHA